MLRVPARRTNPMKTRWSTCAAFLSVVLYFGAVGQAGGIKLRYGFQSQKQYKCRTVMEVKTVGDASKNTIPADLLVELTIGVTLKVEKVLKGDQFACVLVLDTLTMQASAPDREKIITPLDYLQGKSMRMNLDTRGIASGIAPTDSVSSQQAMQAVGFDLFSRELLSRMTLFLQFPEKSIEVGEGWSYSRIDTVERNGQRMLAQRITQCTLLADSTIKTQSFHRISYSTIARLEGFVGAGSAAVALKGTTTNSGTLFLSQNGIPSRSSAHLESDMRIGGVKTVKQKGTVESVVE
jgi:hypothetical protein